MAIFSLVDCNNFYVSCERIFNPKLRNKPVVVLSNNDGCVIARSNEAKLLGIKMGEPYFQMRKRSGKTIIALSSNYSLYGDISHRVMQILTENAPDIEYYSIDEAFLRLDGIKDLENYAKKLRQQVYQCVGIPVSVGIATTKVLAKVANHIAKRHTVSGTKVLIEAEERDSWLKQFPIEDLWGIGHQWAKKLHHMHIVTAYHLQQSDSLQMRKIFNVMLARMIYELRGIPCYDLEMSEPKKSIVSSRSFGKLITRLEDLQQALSVYTSRACEKLRDQKSLAQQVSVFICTNPFIPDEPQRSVSLQTKLPFATHHTSEVLHAASFLLQKLFRQGYRYQKAGVMLGDFICESALQQSFSFMNKHRLKDTMPVLDAINQRFGQDTLFLGSSGIAPEWQMRREKLSQHFTTQWDELLVVK